MKKWHFVLAMVCLVANPLSAKIKDFIFVVYPEYSEIFLHNLKIAEKTLNDEGFSDVSDAMRGISEKSFGSGFLYVAEDGTNYVATNRHVVQDASSVKLDQEQDDGSIRTYKNCPVVLVDDDLDLALIAFPSGQKPFVTGLDFDTVLPEDGTEVWSAGYPALGNTPKWQLGKGSVTNYRLKLPELVDPDKSLLIQHSAQVDSGNSGGPLLVSRKEAVSGYAVVGVNTWKAVYRESTNLTIPVSTVKHFIDRARAMGNGDKSDLDVRIIECIALSSNGDLEKEVRIRKLSKFISYSYIQKNGTQSFITAYRKSTETFRKELVSAVLSSPLDGMRLSIAWQINEALLVDGKSDAMEKDGAPSKAESGVVSQKIMVDGKVGSLDWIQESGSWRIAGIVLPKGHEVKNADSSANRAKVLKFKSPYYAYYFGNVVIRGDKNFYYVGLCGVLDRFAVFGFKAGGTSIRGYDSYTEKYCADALINVNVFSRLQLPIPCGSISIIPYAEALGGMETDVLTMDSDYSDHVVIGGISGGLMVVFGSGSGLKLILDSACGKISSETNLCWSFAVGIAN